LAGVEALVRWPHPIRGLIRPDEFIPVAEHSGLIDGLTERVLTLALRQVAAWRRCGFEIPVAVNLSMRNLHDQQLAVRIGRLRAQFAVPARLLAVELTESTLMADPGRTVSILRHLRGMGIKISIDDFGTGQSSLTYLKHLPMDELKIDRSFICDIVRDTTDRHIVRATIDLAHSLGLSVVAEGVEDACTQALLNDMGCDQAQGFHLSRPLAPMLVTDWLLRNQRDLAA
jgi:EAL domain-containing protein (putative c-di-GMP-specific phosphodiesterase class I)